LRACSAVLLISAFVRSSTDGGEYSADFVGALEARIELENVLKRRSCGLLVAVLQVGQSEVVVDVRIGRILLRSVT
jgi:hypothetical protein